MKKQLLQLLILSTVLFGIPTQTFAQSPSIVKKTAKVSPAHITGAKITKIDDASLTITKDTKTYTVTLLPTTKLRRHFWGKSTIKEMSVGDSVNVWGKFTDTAQTIIEGRIIRDISIMKRHGIFVGTVKSKDATGFVLSSKNRGDQTVITDTNTKVTDKKGTTISLSDVKVGDRVRVDGVWDKTLSKITQVDVKDYSIGGK